LDLSKKKSKESKSKYWTFQKRRVKKAKASIGPFKKKSKESKSEYLKIQLRRVKKAKASIEP